MVSLAPERAGATPRWRAWLFDLDGTLVDSTPLHARAFVEVLSAEAPQFVAEFDYRNVMGMETGDAFASLGVKGAALIERLTAMKRQRYRDLAEAGHLREMPGASDLIGYLRERGAIVGVVTSASAGSAQLSLRATDLISKVDFLVSSADAPRAKPHPDLYLRALGRGGTRPIESVAVEDAPAGVWSARSAGLAVVGVHDPSVAPVADNYFESLDALRQRLIAGAVAT